MIKLENITKEYITDAGPVKALNGIDLSIPDGEIIAITGQSGSGKSSLMNVIGCLDSPTSGRYFIDTADIGSLSDFQLSRLRGKIFGFIFQSYNLLPVYTVFENVELPLILNKINKKDRMQKVNQAIEWVGLTNKRNSKPNMLSGGECQRTAIARALVHDPVLVMADEPTANLDAENSHNIMKILTKLNKELDTSFVFATHDEKIMGYLKRIIRLEDGNIVNDKKITKENI